MKLKLFVLLAFSLTMSELKPIDLKNIIDKSMFIGALITSHTLPPYLLARFSQFMENLPKERQTNKTKNLDERAKLFRNLSIAGLGILASSSIVKCIQTNQ